MEPEKRLIDANARIEEIRKAYCHNCENYNGVKCRACWVDDAIGLIDDATTVDAVPVPCKLGQMIYEVVRVKNGMVSHINHMKVVGIHVGDFPDLRGHKRKSYLVVTHPTSYLLGRVPLDKIGKTVFITKEAAERATYPCEHCISGTCRSCEGCSHAGRRPPNDI